MSDSMPPDDGPRRIELLARNCLAHPAARGAELFWNAEVSTEAESADQSLACVVAPISPGGGLGLLGVVDTWLPDPDTEQRAGLAELASELAPLLPGRAASGDANGAAGTRQPVPTVQLGAGANGHVAALEPFLRDVLDHLPDGLLVTRSDGAIVLANQTFGALTGLSDDDVLGRDVRSVLSRATAEGGGSEPLAALLGQPAPGRRLVVAAGSGDTVTVEAAGQLLSTPFAGECLVTLVRGVPSADGAGSVTLEDLVDGMDDGIMCLDETGTVVLANRAANALHGLGPSRTLVGSALPAATALRTEDGQVLAHDHHPGLKVLREGSPCTDRLSVGDSGAGQRHIAVSARPFPVGGGSGALVVLHDTTAEWMEQQRLTHYALHDPLTSLANRYLLLEELRRMLQGLSRRGGSVALVFLDLNSFKSINDEHGHDVGDEVLTAVARRLRGAVRSDDVVARLGGDEFVIAHASPERLPDGDLVVSRVRKVLSAPFRVKGQAFDVGASIGWVSTDTDDLGPESLLAKADRAMYRHKRDRSLARRGAA